MQFVLTDPKMKIPQRGKIYSLNEGYENKWSPAIKEYVKSKKEGKPYGARYIGSMVADVHRTIKYGGVFLYPSTADAPNGKLRVLYECFPMAHIVETAGGRASSGKMEMLDLVRDDQDDHKNLGQVETSFEQPLTTIFVLSGAQNTSRAITHLLGQQRGCR